MKAILLAAGRGTRISRNIKNVPKSTLPINGKSLIRLNVEHFLEIGCEVSVVIGYERGLIEKELEGLKVKFYYNPFYKVTNSIGSIWMARHELEDDDCIIMNADVYYEPALLDKLLEADKEVVMATDSSRIEIGDYFFSTDKDGLIVKYGKGMPIEDRTGEYVGIAVVKQSFGKIFKEEINRLVWEEKYDMWWENALYELADKGTPIATIDVKGLFWSEIDYFDDYLRIIEYAKKH